MRNQTLSSRLPFLVEGLLHTHTSLHGKRGQPETDREMSEFLVVSGLHTPHSCRLEWFQWLPLCEKHICLFVILSEQADFNQQNLCIWVLALFIYLFLEICFHWDTGDGLWNSSMGLTFWWNIQSSLPGTALRNFLIPCSWCSCWQQPLQSTGYSSSLEENLPLFLGDTLVSWPFRVTNWFLYWERSLPLGRLPLPAVSSRSLLTSSSLEEDFFFLGLEKDTDDSSILVSRRASWGFHFLLLRSCARLLARLLSTAAVFQICEGNCNQPFFFFFKHLFSCFSSSLVISASASSAWTIVSITTSRFLQGTSSVS